MGGGLWGYTSAGLREPTPLAAAGLRARPPDHRGLSALVGLLPIFSGHAVHAADSSYLGGGGGSGGSLQGRVAELRMFQSMFGSRSSPTQQLAADVQVRRYSCLRRTT